jgi:hypothetical protein
MSFMEHYYIVHIICSALPVAKEPTIDEMIENSMHVLFVNKVFCMNVMLVFIKFVLNFICYTNKFNGSTNHPMKSKVQ